MAFQTEAYPIERRIIQSMIGEYLNLHSRVDYIEKYDLAEFEINVQNIKRTFIDKVFAICDYYIENKIGEHSRHLYDLHKLFACITFDQEFCVLLNQVKKDRQSLTFCPSASYPLKISSILGSIIIEDVYKKDYLNTVTYLCYEKISYQEVIETLNKIVEQYKCLNM